MHRQDHPSNWNLDQLLEPRSNLTNQVRSRYEHLHNLDRSAPRKLLIQSSDPLFYLAWFLAAHLAEYSVFLAQPHWSPSERDQVLHQIGSTWIAGDDRLQFQAASQPDLEISTPWILIPTGGSSGSIRFAIHTWPTLSASVWGFQSHFNLNEINSLCVLPLYHVSGLMQAMRCLLTQGRLILMPWKDLERGEKINGDPREFCLSLVPTQLHRLLQIPSLIPWLAEFKVILIGGGPSWPDLLHQARSQGLPLSPTYGMTETASQIATLKPQEFLSGQINSGCPLPHAQITIQDLQGQILNPKHTGLITIQARSLALGYYPDLWSEPIFQPQDLGYLDPQGYLHVLGRTDQLIITGGEKVLATEVEAVIHSSGWITDVCVIGVPDPEWGQRVVALYVPKQFEITEKHLQSYLRDQLSPFKIPKDWIHLSTLPRNPQGKLNRAQILQMASNSLQKPSGS